MEKKKGSDLPLRSIIKSLSWRALATITTMTLVFIFTREFTWAIKVGFFEVIAKLMIYYGHERVWNYIKWGVSKNGK